MEEKKIMEEKTTVGGWGVYIGIDGIYDIVDFVSIPSILKLASCRYVYNNSLLNRLRGKRIHSATLYTKRLPEEDSPVWEAAEQNDVKIERYIE